MSVNQEPPSTQPDQPSSETDNREVPSRQSWVRFSDERSFGSITGSEFRIWGDE